LKHYSEICSDIKGRPNTMNRFGVLLDEVPGDMTSGVSDVMLRDICTPIAAVLFGNDNGGGGVGADNEEKNIIREMCETLDHHHAFTVDYRAEDGYDRDLSLHYDNAEITLNILLTDENEFDGGELSFEGPSHVSPLSHRSKKTLLAGRDVIPYEHKLGWGILHMGCEMHCALPVDDGRRSNLIVWCRSATHRLRRGCPMCGNTDRLRETVLTSYLSDNNTYGNTYGDTVNSAGISFPQITRLASIGLKNLKGILK